MKSDPRHYPQRVRQLATRRFHWTDGPVPLGEAWGIVGPRPWTWWWVKRWGKLDCKCIRNPLTGNMSLFHVDCVDDHATPTNRFDVFGETS